MISDKTFYIFVVIIMVFMGWAIAEISYQINSYQSTMESDIRRIADSFEEYNLKRFK